MISSLYDYLEGGFRVFGIHGVEKGVCGCGDPACKALFKHPVISSWQNVPAWSDEQIECFDAMGHFDTGFGALCSGFLVIDVDARNGGVESFRRLCQDCPSAGSAAFVVNTGSGGGSQHHYFRLPERVTIVQTDQRYPGIDIKTSGYVIGAGSMHASGAEYEVARGFPQDITDAPPELVELFRRKEHRRVSHEGRDIDIGHDGISELLSYVKNDAGTDYETWIRIGMAIHHCMSGDGYDLWLDWSAKSPKHDPAMMPMKWHSFGKSPTPAGYGTLLHHAREGGYCEPVTFVYTGPEYEIEPAGLDDVGIDLKRPPGFVGELTQWINGQCLYPRENLAVAAALCAVSSLAGMRYVDALDDMSANVIAFCVAGSGTGKEAVQQAYLKIMRTAGVQGAVHGGFKSEQELMRNLIRHQAAFYSVDELGLVLRKLENASKKGGASYLEGIIGTVMSVYSKANGYLSISGDLKEEIREIMRRELAQSEKRLESLPGDSSADIERIKAQAHSDQIRDALRRIDDGLDSPYLTLLGYTTPVTSNELMGFEQATNGFMARAMIFEDLETNPRRKKDFRRVEMPDALANSIRNLYAPGVFDVLAGGARIEFTGDKSSIPTEPGAASLMADVYDRFYQMAEDQKGATGLEAIPRRGYELAAKVSLILAMPGGLRTAEHVRWAYALAKRDCDNKIKMAYATDHHDESSGHAAKILSLVTREHGETFGVICNRMRKTSKDEVRALLGQMVERGMVRMEKSGRDGNKKPVEKYFAIE